MRKWKTILDVDRRQGDSTANHNAYSKLIWDVWMPHLRTAIRYDIIIVPTPIFVIIFMLFLTFVQLSS